MRTKTKMSLLLAGLLGAATAWAETPPNATTDVPVGGQASTMTQGRPNMATTNNPAVENPAPVGTMGANSPLASEASPTGAMGAAPAPQDHMRRNWFNSDPRLATGEASTMVNGQPNADPDNPLLSMSRDERRAEREMRHADARSRREQATMGQRPAPEAWRPSGTPQ